jgi:serine/threonine protein kinase
LTLKVLKDLKPAKPLKQLLIEKYHFRETEAEGLADFISKILQWEPKDRWTASQLLDHYWLKMIPNYNTKMGRMEHREYRRVNKMPLSPEREAENID